MSRGTPARRRLDQELVRRGLAGTRNQARQLVDEGRVLVSGAVAEKSARLVSPAEPVVVAGDAARFVGRGGHKLQGALERFGLLRRVPGVRAVDAGASTGGFTDALLQAGVAHVWAVDVGRGQLHERLRADPRVTSMERTDVRRLAPEDVGGAADIVVADLSFISLRTVLDALLRLLAPGGDLVVLVKPQFEAGRAEASRARGVIRDPAVWRRVLEEVHVAASERGAAIMGAMASPLHGADGNVEFLLHVRADHPTDAAHGRAAPLLDAAVAEAVATPAREQA